MPAPTEHTTATLHREVFDLLSEGVLWVDAGGRISGVNAAAARLLGYPARELEKMSYFEVNPHLSMMGWKKFRARLAESGTELLDTEFVNAAGKLFSVRGRIGTDPSEKEKSGCCLVFSSTESGRRQADLLEAVERGGETGGWEYNLTTGQVYLSVPVREWLGWSVERDFYPVAEFREKIAAHLPPATEQALAHQLPALLADARLCDLLVELNDAEGGTQLYRLQGYSVENDVEVFKIYGSLRPERETGGGPGGPGRSGVFPFSLDRVPEAIWGINYDGLRLEFANAAACELTGYHRRELLGMPFRKLSPEELAEESEHLLESLREKKYLEHATITLRKDGSIFPTTAKLHYYEDGEEEYAVVVAEDASRERGDDKFLQLHTTTLNTLREWVIWLDADNRVVRMNTAARKKLRRRTSRKLNGLPILELMPGLEIPPLARIRQEQLDGRTRSDINYEYTEANGKTRIVQCHFVQVAAASRLYLSIIGRDVTTEVNNKRRLQQTKKRVDELRAQLESENEALREQIETIDAAGPIITVSKAYQKVLGQIAQVAGTDATVLVTGETGTGKELLARSIHNFSNRAHRQLVSVNCAALPENLIESELFGHERGAFTGAFSQKKGKFELADGGTIFLDEIGELPLDMQAKILRALQEGEIQRIGSAEVLSVDVRIVAATNRDLEQMISAGTFREDLYYRLNVFPIHNLPLRERREDIPVLVKHFTRIYADKMGRAVTQINPRDLERLQEYTFPGNVRELINLVERAVITSTTTTLNLGASLAVLRRNETGPGFSLTGDMLTFEEMQRQYIIEALKRTKGKVTGPGGAAELLQLNGRTLTSKMQKLGVDRNAYARK